MLLTMKKQKTLTFTAYTHFGQSNQIEYFQIFAVDYECIYCEIGPYAPK